MGHKPSGRTKTSERWRTCGGVVKSAVNVAGFYVQESEFPAGRNVACHGHADPCLSILLRGSYRERSALGYSECMPGTTIFHPPSAKHALEFAAARSRMIFVVISHQAGKHLDGFGLHFDARRQLTNGLLAAIGYRLSAALGHDDEARALSVEGLILELLGEALQSGRPEKTGPSVRTALAIIHDRFRESISLSSIADQVGVSPMHLARQFHSMTGMTVGGYIRKLRIESACQRLMQSSVSLAELAAELGFADHAHLSRTFKKIVGISPDQFRAAHRQR